MGGQRRHGPDRTARRAASRRPGGVDRPRRAGGCGPRATPQGGPPLDGLALLGERAALAGLTRGGAVSCGGGPVWCRRATGGWRSPSPAPRTSRPCPPGWAATSPVTIPGRSCTRSRRPRRRPRSTRRPRLLGLPFAAVGSVGPRRRLRLRPARAAPVGSGRTRSTARPLGEVTVVDLSSLWAGPLCGQLLAEAGARVIKVESTGRPDGARRGPAPFFDLLNGAKRSVALDLASAAGRRDLGRLIARRPTS